MLTQRNEKHLDELLLAYGKDSIFHHEQELEHLWYAHLVVQAAKINKVSTILSLGIGHKLVPDTIIDEFGISLEKYVILEGSLALITDYCASKQLPPNTQIINTLFEDFSMDEKFDAIEMGFVLEHVDDPAFLVGKYVQFLKPGGIIFVSVPNALSMHRRLGKYANLLDDMYRLSDGDLHLGHKRYFDPKSITSLLIEAGIKVNRIEGIFLKPLTTSQFESLGLSKKVIRAFFQLGSEYPELCNAVYLEGSV